MGNPFDPMNILLVVFAVVAFIRLRSTLGKRTGNEEPLGLKETLKVKQNGEAKPFSSDEAYKLSTDEVLSKISKKDKNFKEDSFLSGAKSVYQMIIKSYAAGDLKDVKQFLGKDVYSGFLSAINSRIKQEQKLFNELINFDSIEIKGAAIIDDNVEITISFETKIISYATDKDGQTIEGNQDSPQSITDTWVFEKSINSKDPNWILVSTNPDN